MTIKMSGLVFYVFLLRKLRRPSGLQKHNAQLYLELPVSVQQSEKLKGAHFKMNYMSHVIKQSFQRMKSMFDLVMPCLISSYQSNISVVDFSSFSPKSA